MLNTKRVVFIRHAQTQENIKYFNLCQGLHRIRNFQFPTFNQVMDSLSLLQMNLDSPLSDLGYQQVNDIKLFLEQSQFWELFQPLLHLHSPLKRTKETLLGILPQSEIDKNDSNSNTTTTSERLIVELSCLRELYPHEYMFSSSVLVRQRSFLQYLDTVNAKRIVVVGHGRYIKMLLNLKEELRNVDIIEVEYTSGSINQPGTFHMDRMKRIYRSPLSTPNPMEAIVIGERNQSITSSSPPTVVDENNEGEDEPTCRICQMTVSETPTLKMIRPCKCSGSLSYVHLPCLNQWRATSYTAKYSCSVCKYQYRFERTLLASLLVSERGAIMITLLILFGFVLFVGYFIHLLSNQYNIYRHNLHPVNLFYTRTHLNPWWRVCEKRINQENGPYSIKSLRSNIYNHLLRISLREKIIFCFNYANDVDFQIAGFCYPQIIPMIHILENGMICISIIAFIVFMIIEISNRRFMEYSVFLGYWILTSSQFELGKLAVALGFGIACRHIYLITSSYGRQIGQYLGEQILEPHR